MGDTVLTVLIFLHVCKYGSEWFLNNLQLNCLFAKVSPRAGIFASGK